MLHRDQGWSVQVGRKDLERFRREPSLGSLRARAVLLDEAGERRIRKRRASAVDRVEHRAYPGYVAILDQALERIPRSFRVDAEPEGESFGTRCRVLVPPSPPLSPLETVLATPRA